MTPPPSRWLDLDGTANTRDLAGLPVAGGGAIRAGCLIRSDNLQALSAADLSLLVETLGVRTVLDLRTGAERRSEGPGPLQASAQVRHVHLPLIPETPTIRHDPGAVLPDRWADGATGAYLHYLHDAPPAFAAAARLLARPASGATIVHCAAGKDRTGVLVAIVLEAVGVDRETIVADYALTNERIERIFDRLAARETYAADVRRIGLDAHRVDAASMTAVLDVVAEKWGGAVGYLRAAGLLTSELTGLRERLVERAPC